LGEKRLQQRGCLALPHTALHSCVMIEPAFREQINHAATGTRLGIAGTEHHMAYAGVLNRAGMTFRKLPDEKKQNLTEAKVIALMLAQPGMIKRPIVESDDRCMAGFDEVVYRAAFAKKP
jgi:arsenate reductase-like glutaredoxin family protein